MESGNEIHDDLYITYCQLLSLPDDEAMHYRHFLLENGTLNCITLKESTNLISQGTTGLCSWQVCLLSIIFIIEIIINLIIFRKVCFKYASIYIYYKSTSRSYLSKTFTIAIDRLV